jgi:hypothetical protein
MKTPFVIDNEVRREYFEQLFRIDASSFSEEPTENEIAWAEERPWMYRVLRRRNDVLGYTLVMPLRKVAFDALRSGRIWEHDIRVKDISDDPEGFYIGSVASSPSVRLIQPVITGTLLGVMAGQVGRSNKEVMAVPVSRVGEKIAQTIQMQPLDIFPEAPGVKGHVPQVYVKGPDMYTPLNIG